MYKIKLGLVLIAIFTLFGVGSQSALASSRSEQMVVILTDRQVVAETRGGLDLAWSVSSLVASLSDGQPFLFIAADQPAEALGPLPSEDPEFKASRSSIEDRLASIVARRDPDMVTALTATFNLLGSHRAARGSTVYVVSGGTPTSDLDEAAHRLGPTASLFAENGWPIVGLSLPGASPQVTRFLDTVSKGSGGESIPLSVPEGFISLSDLIFKEGAKGLLDPVNETLLPSDSVVSYSIGIPPGTSEAKLIFFRDDSSGSFRLNNPTGRETSSGDRSVSSVIEAPHVVMWHLMDPDPGNWKVDIRGASGVVSAWSYAVNGLGVAMSDMGTIPLNEPTAIVAYATDQQGLTVLDSVSIVARITSPGGKVFAYDLNDDGVSGDAVASDGYYSTTISPLTEQGEHQVELELTWQDVSYKLTSHAYLTTGEFPTIRVSWLQTGQVETGVRTQVATIESYVAGQTFALASDELLPVIASSAERPGKVEVVPVDQLSDGRAWYFDVFFTPEESGQHSLSFEMNTEYAGRQYTLSTEPSTIWTPMVEQKSNVVVHTIPAPEPVIVTSESPPRPVRIVRERLVREPGAAPPAPVTPPIVAVSPPVVAPQPVPASSFEVPSWVPVAVSSALLLALIVAFVYWITRAKPYGYLYNDKDEPVADFGSFERRTRLKLLCRNLISGRELGLPGLEEVSFKFFWRRVGVIADKGSTTLRVNNHPVIGESTIRDRSWIGAHGKLYSFLTSLRPTPAPEPGAADD